MGNIDDEFARMMNPSGDNNDLDGGLELLATRLGKFRQLLIDKGFSSGSSEDISRDWFNCLTEIFVDSEVEEED